MFPVFVPVLSLPTQLTRIKTEASFVAEDPWNSNRPCTFTLESYAVTLRGVKSLPKTVRESQWSGGFQRAIRSEADGKTRFLPESLTELWLTKQIPLEALPALLKQIEPALKKSDYKPILRSAKMKIFAICETVCCAALVILAMIAVVMGHATAWLAALVVAGTASVCWLFLYLVYFGKLFRRKRQMRWLLAAKTAAPVPPPPFHLPRFKTRPASGINIDHEEIVQLMIAVERPRVRLLVPNAEILISRILLEALSTQGENQKDVPGVNDQESRLASMRGSRARLILSKSAPAAPGQDPELQLGQERQAQYLVGELLENGLAQVVLPSTPPASASYIKVRFFGSRMAPTVGFGYISYSTGHSDIINIGEFLRLDWWVS